MNKTLIIRKLITILPIIGVMWLVFFITQLAIGNDPKGLHKFLPADAVISMRINNDVLIKRVIYDFLFQSDLNKNERDQLIFKGEGATLPSLGIDISREIIVFYEDWNKKELIGWLVHLSNTKNFDNFQFNDKSIIKSRADHVGVILQLSVEPENDEDRALFEQYSNDLLIPVPDRSESKRYFERTTAAATVAQLFFEGDPKGFLQKSGVDIQFDQNKLLINGYGKKNPLIEYTTENQNYILPKNDTNYLEIRAGTLPDTLSKYVDFVLTEAAIQLPPIISQQILLYGFEIDNFKGSMAVLPRFDAIFRMDGKFSIEAIMQSMRDMEPSVTITSPNAFLLGKTTYHLIQLTDNELYVGIDENPTIENINDERFFLLAGNAAALFTIEGKGIVAQMAQLVPEVKNSKQLLKTLEKFEIEARLNNEDELVIQGVMSFSPEKKASLEFLKYIMRF